MGSYLSKEDFKEFENSISRNRIISKKILFIFFIIFIIVIVPQLLFYALKNFGQ